MELDEIKMLRAAVIALTQRLDDIIASGTVGYLPKTTSERLKLLLTERGLTQKQLALELGTSPQVVSKWTNARTAPRNYLPQVAEFFDVDEEYITGRQAERRRV